MTSMWFNPESGRTQSWSSGGGTQSTAIAAMIVQGRLPAPDIAVMVDTERENSAVLPYFYRWVQPALASVGVEIAVIKKSQYATVDLTSKNGKHILLPGFTNQSGKVGKLPTYCSGEWKRNVIKRFLREQGVKECDSWIGFSLDEIQRVKVDKTKWMRSVYPLIELRIRRAACIRLVEEMGWPTPPRSACWMCPNQADAEWIDMKLNRTDDFWLAVMLEREIRETDPHFYLHPSCVPLDQVDFKTSRNPLFENDQEGCASGMCFV